MTRLDDRLTLPDPDALADLATFVGRAQRVDPGGAARLVGHGDVLAVYVSPVHGGGGPTVLGLRTLRLALPSDLDVTVPLAALSDRFARSRAIDSEAVTLAVPPVEALAVAWAGMAPGRQGWEPAGRLTAAVLRASAAAGIAEVAAGAPPGSGAAAVSTLRARVWARPVERERTGPPAGVAFAADALGFLVDDEPVEVYLHGPWWRVYVRPGPRAGPDTGAAVEVSRPSGPVISGSAG